MLELWRHPVLIPAMLVLAGSLATLAVQGARELPHLRATWHGAEGRYRTVLAALAAGAILLRLVGVPATPEVQWHHMFATSLGNLGVDQVLKYGLGFEFLLLIPMAVLGPSYDLVYGLNAVIGGLCVLPAAGFLRALGARDATALWCAATFAATPMLAFFAHTPGPFVAGHLFLLVMCWAIARYGVEARTSWIVTAAAAAVLAAQMRVEAALMPVLGVALAVLVWPRARWRRREVWLALGGTVVLLLPHAAVVWDATWNELGRRADRTTTAADRAEMLRRLSTHFMVLDPAVQGWGLLLATVLGLFSREVPWRVRAWAVAGALLTALLVPNMARPTGVAFTMIRYQLYSLVFATFLSGLGIAWIAVRLAPPGIVVALVALLSGLPLARQTSILKREHDVFRTHLAAVPSPCTVYALLESMDTTMVPPYHLSELDGHDHTWVDIADDPEVVTDGCAVYWKAAMCTGHYQRHFPPRLPPCVAFEEAWTLTPLVEVTMTPEPIGPLGIASGYPELPIEVGFYRIEGPAD